MRTVLERVFGLLMLPLILLAAVVVLGPQWLRIKYWEAYYKLRGRPHVVDPAFLTYIARTRWNIKP